LWRQPGDLVSQLVPRGGGFSGLIAVQGNLGKTFTSSSGQQTRLGGFTSAGPASGQVVVLGCILGDVCITGGLAGGRIAAKVSAYRLGAVHSDLVAVHTDSVPVHTDFAPVILITLFGSRTVSYNPPRRETGLDWRCGRSNNAAAINHGGKSMRYIIAAIVIGGYCLHSPAQDKAEDTAKLRAELARLQAEVAHLGKIIRDVQTGAAEAKNLEGTWVIETARQDGKEIAGEQGGEIEFFGNVVFARFPGQKELIRQTFQVFPSEKQIAFLSGTGRPTFTSLDYFHGLYERDGDTLRVSLLGYGVPRDVSDRNLQRLWVLKRKKG
jgi:uncharacterized protein (TIGR03067 family)